MLIATKTFNFLTTTESWRMHPHYGHHWSKPQQNDTRHIQECRHYILSKTSKFHMKY